MARCIETIDVCIWRMFVVQLCSACLGVCGNVCCVAAVDKDSAFLLLECCMLYVCVRGVMDVVFSVCIVTRGTVGARIWEV